MANDEQLINEVLHDPYDIGGRKPRKLTSSWNMHERFPLPPRKPQHLFFLDELRTGTTVARAFSLEAAYECLEKLKKQGIRVCIRPETIDEDSLAADTRLRKWKAQMGLNPVTLRD